jgi:hypothetical protein
MMSYTQRGDKTMKSMKVLLAVALLGGLALAQTSNPSTSSAAAGASFDRLKSLAGEWEGTTNEAGHTMATTTSFRVVSDGSALMNVLAASTPHEMVTMFHMDGNDLLGTHYCAAHNQPRFRYVFSPDSNVVAFEFKDATNLASPEAPHMVGVRFTLIDQNHHLEDWTFLANGQASVRRFDFHRKS